MANLHTLPTELKLLIIQHIKCTVNTTEIAPAELHIPFTVHLSSGAILDLASLSRVGRSLRNLVAPHLFHSLVLRNTVKSGESVALIAKSDHARHVKSLELITASARVWEVEYDQPNYPCDEMQGMGLPENVEQVLSNLNCFPNLERLVIDLRLKEQCMWRSIGDYVDYFDFEIDEVFEGWRPMVDRIYRAVVRNTHSKLKTLTLRNIRPYDCAAWQDPAWHTFLRCITTFKLQFYDRADNKWNIARSPYHTFLPHLAQTLWPYLCNVTHLTLSASSTEFTGADFVFEEGAPLCLPKFPKLQTLELDYIFMGNAVLDILMKHAQTLQRVRMQHIFVARTTHENVYDDLEPQMTWAIAFATLSESTVPWPRLVGLEILCTGDGKSTVMRAQEVRDTERMRKYGDGEPELRYTITDWEDAGVRPFDVEEQRGVVRDLDNGNVVIREKEDGVQADLDRLAYEGFMRIVWGNRQRLGRE